MQSTVYQTDDHAFGGLEADSVQKSFPAVKCVFSISSLVFEKNREVRTGRGRAGASTLKLIQKTMKLKKRKKKGQKRSR